MENEGARQEPDSQATTMGNAMLAFGRKVLESAGADGSAAKKSSAEMRADRAALIKSIKSERFSLAWSLALKIAQRDPEQLMDLWPRGKAPKARSAESQGFVDFLVSLAQQDAGGTIRLLRSAPEGVGAGAGKWLDPNWIANSLLVAMKCSQQYVALLIIAQALKGADAESFIVGMSGGGLREDAAASGGDGRRAERSPLEEALHSGFEEAAVALIQAGGPLKRLEDEEEPRAGFSTQEPRGLKLFAISLQKRLGKASQAMIEQAEKKPDGPWRGLFKNGEGLKLAASHGGKSAALAMAKSPRLRLERWESLAPGQMPMAVRLIAANMDEAAVALIKNWSDAGAEGAEALSLSEGFGGAFGGASALSLALQLGKKELALMLIAAGVSLGAPCAALDNRGMAELAAAGGVPAAVAAIAKRLGPRAAEEGRLGPQGGAPLLKWARDNGHGNAAAELMLAGAGSALMRLGSSARQARPRIGAASLGQKKG